MSTDTRPAGEVDIADPPPTASDVAAFLDAGVSHREVMRTLGISYRRLRTLREELSKVYTSTVELVPTVWCEMPDGRPCEWAPRPTTRISPAQARMHAQDNPGHYVTREMVSRTRWARDPTLTPRG